MFLKIYAGMLIVIFAGFISFYITEYIVRGGRLIRAIRGVIRLAVVLLPLALLVFLQADRIMWPNRAVWRLYALLLLAYCVRTALSSKSRNSWRNLKEKMRAWPVIGSVISGVLLLLILPALILLLVYVVK